MDPMTKLQIAALLKEADHAADAKTKGLLDRDELTAVIRQLIASTRMLLDESEAPFHRVAAGFPAAKALPPGKNVGIGLNDVPLVQ